jgi:predicted nucleic-acid-binding protein
LRYLLQDDPKQASRANYIFDRVLSQDNLGFITLVTVLEIVWALRSLLKRTHTEIATHLDDLLAADTLEVQNEQQVFEAVFALKRGTGVRGCLDRRSERLGGLPAQLTVNKRALRMPYFQLLIV